MTKANFNELLEFAFKNLIAGQSVKFKDISGEFEASNFTELNENFNLLMPTNLKNLPKIFIANEAEQVALASYEKPAVTLKRRRFTAAITRVLLDFLTSARLETFSSTRFATSFLKRA